MKSTTSPFRSNFYLWNGVSAIFFSNCVTTVTMFGISPSQFLRENKTMDIFTCDRSPRHFETTVYDANGQPEKIYK
jgi:hypothetical protein